MIQKTPKTDWICVFRYLIAGALLVGFIADIAISDSALSVYSGAVLGGIAAAYFKLFYVDRWHEQR